MSLPSVFAYLDHRAFLDDWFKAKKRQDPATSYSTFAAAAGCSRSALANVLGGVRLPRPQTLDAFARAMELTPSERNYLGLLVELEGAQEAGDRARVMDRILSSERYRQTDRLEARPEGAVSRFLASWVLPAIAELARLPGFRPDPAWIAKTLHPPIDEAEARRALDTLQDLGLLVIGADGAVTRHALRFETGSETATEAVAVFNRDVVSGLLRDLDTSLHASQHVLTSTVLLPTTSVPEVKARLNTLMGQIAGMGDDPAALAGPARIFQISVQLVPLTREVG